MDNKEYFILTIFNHIYKISLLKYFEMFENITKNYNLTYNNYLQYLLLKNFIKSWNLYINKNESLNVINKNFNFLKYIWFILKKNRLMSNIFDLKKLLKKMKTIKKKNNYKILNLYKKNFFFNKQLKFYEKLHLKKKIFLKKKFWKNPRLRKKTNIVKKRVKNYFNNFLKKNLLIKKNSLKQRLFYYDFFFSSFEQKLFLLKKKNSVSFLWKDVLNKTYLRFRLSEYIFFLITEFNNNFFLNKKMYYILNFFKIIVFLKKKLQNLKKYLLKKNILSNLIKINKKNFKYYLKKEYVIQKSLYNNFGKFLIKYYAMLKYFNKIFYFLLKILNFNIKKIINKYNNFVYLSFLINLTINKKNYISLVNLNNYFMEKTNKSFINAWLLNDNIFNYITIYDKAFKKDLYWNNLSPIYSLASCNTEKSYIMIPSINKNLNEKFTYFFGKKLKINSNNNYYINIYNYYFIFLIINFFNYFNNKFNKFYLLNFIINKSNDFILPFKNFDFIQFNNINFINKLKIIKFYLKLKSKIKLQNLTIYKKKIFIMKLFIWLFFYSFKQKYNFVKLQNLNYFLNTLFNNIKNYFTSFNKSTYLNNTKLTLIEKKSFFKNLMTIKKNKYVFKIFFLNIIDNYYTIYSKYNKYNYKKCILHLVEKKTNNFLVLSLFDTRRVIGHTSSGQGLNRAYNNSKRQKKGTWILGKIIFKKLRLRARKYALKEVFLKSNLYWNFRINFLTKYWVLRYKLGIPYLKGLKLGLGLPYHKGLRVNKRKRK